MSEQRCKTCGYSGRPTYKFPCTICDPSSIHGSYWYKAPEQVIPSTPPPPLCLTCSHANMSVTDDFADCLCAKSGGYEGGKTECKDYERKRRNDGSTL